MITTLRSDSRSIKKASEYKVTKQSVYTPAVDEGISKEKAKGKFYFVKAIGKDRLSTGSIFLRYLKFQFILASYKLIILNVLMKDMGWNNAKQAF